VVGSLWNVQLNAKAILDSGIKLNSDEWILFTAIHSMFGTKWANTKTEDGNTYVMVSNKFIRQQLVAFPDLADISNVTLWRKIKNIENAGLLTRYSKNSENSKCYLGLGDNVDLLTNAPISKLKGDPLQNCNTPLSEMKGYNTIIDNRIINNSIPPTPLAGSPQAVEPLDVSVKKSRVKKRITDKEASEFYAAQLKDFPPTPKDFAGGVGATRKDMYCLLARWMFRSQTGLPDGFKGTVLNMGGQLAFDEYCNLIDEHGLNDYQIRQYLIRMHNYEDRHRNKTIYFTILHWYRDDVKKGSIPPKANPSKPVSTGIKRASATNEDYSA